MFRVCPGLRKALEPSITVRSCPACGAEVEFFDFETETRCPNCGKLVHREATPVCVKWCKFALRCIADLEARNLIPKEVAEQLRRIALSARKKKTQPDLERVGKPNHGHDQASQI